MTKIEFHNIDLGVNSVLYTRQYLSVESDEINRFSANRAMTEHSVTTLHLDAKCPFYQTISDAHHADLHLMSLSSLYVRLVQNMFLLFTFHFKKPQKSPHCLAILQFKPF
jgi:hypothetical protein